jgi:nicotinate-nucleotide pyrophosphorylase (carboxylating)
MNPLIVEELLSSYLKEDIGRVDLTTEGIYRGEKIKAVILAKESGIIAGIPFAAKIFRLLGTVNFKFHIWEGKNFQKGDIIMEISGDAKAILMGERTALNLLQRLSGIATKTFNMVKKIKNYKVKLLDTRKTTPGFRLFEKYAVKVGGGENHRYALYDMVLIKDNHIKVAGSIKEAVRRVKSLIPPFYKIEVETTNLKEVEEALEVGVDIIMLDNFTVEDIRKAVQLIRNSRKEVLIEVSGGINEENIEEYAKTGIDFISSGSIIHSAKWIDLSLKVL